MQTQPVSVCACPYVPLCLPTKTVSHCIILLSLSLHQSVLSVNQSVYVSACLPACQCIGLSVSVDVYITQFTCSVCVCVCVCVYACLPRYSVCPAAIPTQIKAMYLHYIPLTSFITLLFNTFSFNLLHLLNS